MPIYEGPTVDGRTGFVRALIEWVKDDEIGQAPYRARHDELVAKAASREALRERMRRVGSSKKPKKPGSRPWQKAGFVTRQAWLDATQEEVSS